MDIISRMKFDTKCLGRDLMALSSKPVYLYELLQRVSKRLKSKINC